MKFNHICSSMQAIPTHSLHATVFNTKVYKTPNLSILSGSPLSNSHMNHGILVESTKRLQTDVQEWQKNFSSAVPLDVKLWNNSSSPGPKRAAYTKLNEFAQDLAQWSLSLCGFPLNHFHSPAHPILPFPCTIRLPAAVTSYCFLFGNCPAPLTVETRVRGVWLHLLYGPSFQVKLVLNRPSVSSSSSG